ncbi:hypothetical protein BU14_0291s0009 [Porphyra umbilicalis]|uniref:GST N-terminal domain-containing protein n=1 Tax=Porphyra umbilicalis TaxID=2786 RepID=A0A1X6P0V2_PORUM|nr:hypothetical protein BU14_0291s0009 [Porphyra umbilicalis]|eukprot:OSX74390.1 hypothetical protein BU14_0291s0009 [Porphyra umbilicalis]
MSFPAFTPAPLLAATAVAARLRGSRAPRRAPHRGPCTPTSPIAFRRASAPAAGRRGVVTMAAATPTDTKGIMYVKAGPDGKSVGDCPFSLKALLAAALKGVAVDIVPVDLSNKPDTFLALTDAGSTPVFVHGGRTLTDSADIVAYVDTLGDGAAAAGGGGRRSFPPPRLPTRRSATPSAASLAPLRG